MLASSSAADAAEVTASEARTALCATEPTRVAVPSAVSASVREVASISVAAAATWSDRRSTAFASSVRLASAAASCPCVAAIAEVAELIVEAPARKLPSMPRTRNRR